MALKELILALGTIVAASAASATPSEPAPAAGAPAAGPDARYCMRIEAITGSRLEELKCWTRDEWAEQGVDVDKEWAKEGVSVIG
jgi:hypothetical protein